MRPHEEVDTVLKLIRNSDRVVENSAFYRWFCFNLFVTYIFRNLNNGVKFKVSRLAHIHDA